MPNITVTVDESAYQRARIAAALRNTTVTQLVREFLRELDRQTAQLLPADHTGLVEPLGLTSIDPDLDFDFPRFGRQKTQNTKYSRSFCTSSGAQMSTIQQVKRPSLQKKSSPSPLPCHSETVNPAIPCVHDLRYLRWERSQTLLSER